MSACEGTGRMKIKDIKTGISLLLLLGISFHFGRLFEIFAWNTNIIRIESISHFSNSDETASYNYNQLNERYWEEKDLERDKIRIDFSEQYRYLNLKVELKLVENQDNYLSNKPEMVKRPLMKVIYPDSYLCH